MIPGATAADNDCIMRWVVFVFLIAIQAVRVVYGVDFNDEMQYYGQLLALAKTGQFFTSDLFVQQAGYLLLLPLVKPYLSIFGVEGFVGYCRGLYALYVVFLFFSVYQRLVRAQVPDSTASFAALLASFAVTWVNIYAFSYNTLAQGFLLLAAVEHYCWHRDDPRLVIRAAALSTLLVLVHPPLALPGFFSFFVRFLIERRYAAAFRLAGYSIVGAGAVGFLLYSFSQPADVFDAIRFSAGFGAGKTVFLKSDQANVLLLVVLVVTLVIAGRRLLGRRMTTWRWLNAAWFRVAVIAGFILAGCASVFMANLPTFRALAMDLLVLLFVTSIFFVLFADEQEGKFIWMLVVFLMSGVTAVIASSNGMLQLQAAAMIFLPFAFCYVSENSTAVRLLGARASFVLVLLFGATLLVSYVSAPFVTKPYQEGKIWQLTTPIQSGGALGGLRTTPEKVEAVEFIRAVIASEPASRLLVIGAQPWIYLASGVAPETQMLFMHSAGGAVAAEVLVRRLTQLTPDRVLIVSEVEPEIVLATSLLVDGLGLFCTRVVTPNFLRAARSSIYVYRNFLPQFIDCRKG